MVKIFGIERNKCEEKGCKKKGNHILMTGIKQGFNTWIFCRNHYEKHKKVII